MPPTSSYRVRGQRFDEHRPQRREIRRNRLREMGQAAEWEAEERERYALAHAHPEFGDLERSWGAVVGVINLRRFAQWARSV